MTMTTKTLTTLTALMVAHAAFAGQTFQKADVAADAKWVAHFDVQKYMSSAIGRLIAAKAEKEGVGSEQGLAFLKDTIGIDPSKDMLSVTLYASRYGCDNAIAVIQGQVNNSALVDLLRNNETHKETPYGDFTIHTWVDKNKKTPAAGAFYSDRVTVLARTSNLVKQALDVLAGTKPSLDEAADGMVVPDPGANVFLFVYGSKCEGQLKGHSHAQLVQSADNIAFAAGDNGTDVELAMQIGATTAEKALQMQTMIQGMIAFMVMQSEQDPSLMALSQALSLETVEKVIQLSLTYPADKLMALCEAQKKLAQQRRARMRQHFEKHRASRAPSN